MARNKTVARNREMFSARQQGATIEDLAKRYGLSPATVYQIMRIEGHKMAVSVDAFYEEMRSLMMGVRPNS